MTESDKKQALVYKEFVEGLSVPLIRIDLQSGNFLVANKMAAQLLGQKTVDDLINNVNFYSLCSPEDRDRLLTKLYAEKQIERHEIQLNINNETLWVSARFQLNCGGTCIEGTIINVTDRVKVRNTKLKELERISQQLDVALATG